MSATRAITADDLYEVYTVEDARLSPDGRWIAYTRALPERTNNRNNRTIWLVPTQGAGAPRQFTRGGRDGAPRWSPDGTRLAFLSVRDGEIPQVYVIALAGGEAWSAGSLKHGASDIAWSPDGTQIACLSAANALERQGEDDTHRPEPPRDALEARHRREREERDDELRADPRVYTRLPFRTGTSYLDDRTQHIYILDASGEKPARRLTHGDENYTAPAWTPDGQAILSTQGREPGNEYLWLYLDIVSINVASSAVTRIAQPGFTAYEPIPSPDGRWIACARAVDDPPGLGILNRLAIVPTDGGAARDVNVTLDRSVAAYAWSPDSRWLYCVFDDRGYSQVYRVRPTGGKPQCVLSDTLYISGLSAGRGGLAFIAYTAENPGDVYWHSGAVDSEVVRRTEVNAKWLEGKDLARTEEQWHHAPDGTLVQGWIVKPPDFDAETKYPLAVSIHGGPWIMWSPGYPAIWLEWQIFAARGYVVYFCNPRGSEGYGEAWMQAIKGRWGDVDGHDILSGVDAVVAQEYVDTRHIGVLGGSYGGFMTAWLIGHDQRFSVAVAQRGLFNLVSMWGTSDIPELIEWTFGEEPLASGTFEALWRYSPLAYVADMHAPLMILHSDNDYRTPASEAEQLFVALRRLGRTVEMVRYPRDGHEMSRSGEPLHRVDRLRRMADWFDRFCKPGRRKRD